MTQEIVDVWILEQSVNKIKVLIIPCDLVKIIHFSKLNNQNAKITSELMY